MWYRSKINMSEVKVFPKKECPFFLRIARRICKIPKEIYLLFDKTVTLVVTNEILTSRSSLSRCVKTGVHYLLFHLEIRRVRAVSTHARDSFHLTVYSKNREECRFRVCVIDTTSVRTAEKFPDATYDNNDNNKNDVLRFETAWSNYAQKRPL